MLLLSKLNYRGDWRNLQMIGTFLCVRLGVVMVWRNVAYIKVKCCEGEEGDVLVNRVEPTVYNAT